MLCALPAATKLHQIDSCCSDFRCWIVAAGKPFTDDVPWLPDDEFDDDDDDEEEYEDDEDEEDQTASSDSSSSSSSTQDKPQEQKSSGPEKSE